MEIALQSTTRRPEPALHAVGPTVSDAPRTLTVTAVYRLSEAGRKALLLAGGDGREHQHVPLAVPVTRLHLVHVDAHGVARLKLRPRYEMNRDRRVLRIDAPPMYDSPPTIDSLFEEAARNHELERSYYAQRAAARAAREQSDDDWRNQLALAFLNDPSQRAIAHPAPTPRRCEIATERGRVRFDSKWDRGIAREVPLEGFRRFRADVRARRERAQQQRAEHIAIHEEKRRVIGEWIATYGTADQQTRQAAGVLPAEKPWRPWLTRRSSRCRIYSVTRTTAPRACKPIYGSSRRTPRWSSRRWISLSRADCCRPPRPRSGRSSRTSRGRRPTHACCFASARSRGPEARKLRSCEP